MSDRIEKALANLSVKERTKFIALLELIVSGQFFGLDMKKLKGHAGAYRVRKGNFRVIFTMTDTSDIQIIVLERRADTTYSGL